MWISGRRAGTWIVDHVGDPMSAAAGSRLASVLFVLCGALVMSSTLLPSPAGADRRGLLFVGGVAIAAGVVFWFLPWARWGRHANLFIELPVAFSLVTAHNWLTDADGYRYGLFFLVMFVWLGLTHPPGYSLRVAPILVAAYAAPLVLGTSLPGEAALASLFYAVPICVLIGETGAAVAGRLRASEAALRSSEQRWRSLVLNASDPIVVIDRDGIVQYATPAAGRLFGRPGDTVGDQVLDLIHPDDVDFVLDRLAAAIAQTGGGDLIEFRVTRADGRHVWVECLGTNLLDDPSVRGIVCNVRDITERKETEDFLRHRSKHDSLTELPNRHHFVETVGRRVEAGEPFALLLLDLDRFKEINDALGHETGDRVLVDVARRLTAGAAGTHFVARLGGDEFAIVVDACDEDAAGAVAAELLHAFDEPFELDGMALHVGASIGVAASQGRDSDDNLTVLLQRADVAMYRAKSAGAGWATFGRADEQNRPARLAMVSDLRDAIDAGDVVAHYQPQLDLRTGTVKQVEVLARWKRNGVDIRPDVFVPLAEHTGLIARLTTSILRQSLAQAKRWADVGLPVAVAVNVSALTMRDPLFLASIIDALAEARVPPSTLTLEITESALADHTDGSLALMRELRSAGIRLSIDDFGSGYSSMAYLKRLPIDELKIDQAFITDMLSDERDQPITRSIIELAHSLGLDVVAEGVESPALQTMLEGFGCDTAQGYGICRPVAAAELTAWLAGRVASEATTPETATVAHLHVV